MQKNRDYFSKVPVLIIDLEPVLKDDAYRTFLSRLNTLVKYKLIKLIIVATNGTSKNQVDRNVDVIFSNGNGHEKWRLDIDFPQLEVEKILKQEKSPFSKFVNDSCFSLIVKATYNVTGGRIGCINKICNIPRGSSRLTDCKCSKRC